MRPPNAREIHENTCKSAAPFLVSFLYSWTRRPSVSASTHVIVKIDIEIRKFVDAKLSSFVLSSVGIANNRQTNSCAIDMRIR